MCPTKQEGRLWAFWHISPLSSGRFHWLGQGQVASLLQPPCNGQALDWLQAETSADVTLGSMHSGHQGWERSQRKTQPARTQNPGSKPTASFPARPRPRMVEQEVRSSRLPCPRHLCISRAARRGCSLVSVDCMTAEPVKGCRLRLGTGGP